MGRLLPALARGRPLWVAARWSRAFARRVRALVAGWRPEIIQMEYHAMGQYAAALHPSAGPRVLTFHEPGVQAAAELAARSRGARRIFWQRDLRMWRRYERELLDSVDAAVVFTERDRSTLAGLGGRAPLVRIPLSVPLPPAPLDPLGTDPPALLFLGNFVHPPNADAARHLARDIFPALRDLHPTLQLWIVGPGGAVALDGLDLRSIVVTGRVPDVTPWLERCAIVVAPLRLGGGMRVKVAEALAAGKAIVATSIALEGLDLEAGRDALVAEDARDFTIAISSLLDDPERRAALARAARDWAESNLGRQRFVDEYARLYERLLEGRGVPAGCP